MNDTYWKTQNTCLPKTEVTPSGGARPPGPRALP